MDIILHLNIAPAAPGEPLPSSPHEVAHEVEASLGVMFAGWEVKKVRALTGKDLYERYVMAAGLTTGPWTLLPAATRDSWNQIAGAPAVEEEYVDPADMGAVAANLASLNEIITEVVAATCEDAAFAEVVRQTLRDHTLSLGFQFQGITGPREGKAAEARLRLAGRTE